MCGIIAVLRRPSDRTPPSPGDLWSPLGRARSALAAADPAGDIVASLEAAAEGLEELDGLLRGTPGIRCLLGDDTSAAVVDRQMGDVAAIVDDLERRLDSAEAELGVGDIERINAVMIRLKDAAWAVRRDRIPTARAVADLAGRDPSPAAIDAFASVQAALSALDRLEVRGRDSAGLHLLVRNHGLDLNAPDIRALADERRADPLFGSGALRTPAGHLAFVYKAAAEIGELGDNTRELRDAIKRDALLHRALLDDEAWMTVLGHTRWASVGIISQPNAHPLNSEEEGAQDGPYVAGVLNGDVDNYADLKASEQLRIAPEITTDAKVIPTLVSRHLAADVDTDEAFRRTVAALEGSVAIAASTAGDPDGLLLALRGSGQALYVGVADDLYIVASEPYGVVEETNRYVRMEGERVGQIIALDGAKAGTLDGIHRFSYDGAEEPVTEDDLHTAEITTRDIDRGDFPHFLLKEISEAPSSFRKTLRGKVWEENGRLAVHLADRALPDTVRQALRGGNIRRIRVIGQGTAAIAGRSVAAAISDALAGSDILVDAVLATELSGFELDDDMSDTLVVAISQSGTTTDTNRTVDLVRAQGGRVIGIVNRRNSDLTDKADGVLYTSDGRDVEMSVASTKAFYAQIAAGFLLAFAIAQEVGTGTPEERHEILDALRKLPEALLQVVERREEMADAASRHAPSRRYWAIVGNGTNRIAAEEVRIKLSELCYKAIACDSTEDKKHIDLSSEPLILVCAAGLTGSTADDVAKEVAIYRAHKAAPIVIATDGARFPAALQVISVPDVHPALAFILSAMAGHLFGYEAALAIDAQARPLREARGLIEDAVSQPGGIESPERLGRALEGSAGSFFSGLRSGAYDGHLEASTAVRLASLFRYATGTAPLEAYQVDFGKVGSPGVVLEDLTSALTRAIEELTRPIDAIKHQAKTVTVGISRADETLLRVPLVREALAAGAPRDRLSYATLRMLADLDPAVSSVRGYTRYAIDGSIEDGTATVEVIDKGGISLDIPSRAERNRELRGTKRRVADERIITVAKGRSDGRTIIIIPEVKDNQPTGLTLLQVEFEDHLTAAAMRGVLQGYRNRYGALKDAVTETEPTFRDDLLATVPVVDLLTEPVNVLADRWRG